VLDRAACSRADVRALPSPVGCLGFRTEGTPWPCPPQGHGVVDHVVVGIAGAGVPLA